MFLTLFQMPNNIEKYCETLDILQNLWVLIRVWTYKKNQYVFYLDDRDQYFWIYNNKYNMQ